MRLNSPVRVAFTQPEVMVREGTLDSVMLEPNVVDGIPHLQVNVSMAPQESAHGTIDIPVTISIARDLGPEGPITPARQHGCGSHGQRPTAGGDGRARTPSSSASAPIASRRATPASEGLPWRDQLRRRGATGVDLAVAGDLAAGRGGLRRGGAGRWAGGHSGTTDDQRTCAGPVGRIAGGRATGTGGRS
jgi:hypothetical protein